jgi:TRAP-type C4-dicarboxylate transport system permease small subunit
MIAAIARMISNDLFLQVGGTPSGTIQAGLLAYELLGAALGVIIAYIAYRGYQRNQSRPMLFISLGFSLALGVPLVATLVYLALPVTSGGVVVQFLTQTFEVAGLLCIIYGLRT